VGATHELLRLRLGARLRRGTLLRLHEASGGNAFVALELARELARRGGDLAPAEPLPLPSGLVELVEGRLGHLPAGVRRLLLTAGALTRPTVEQLLQLDSGAARALRLAEEEGVIEVVSGAVRFTHPLLGLLPYAQLTLAKRRRLHARLVAVAASAEERARHAALSVDGPDSAVASALDTAALEAGRRGAPETAAELATLAASRSPASEEDARCLRLLSAAEWHQRAGELRSAMARAEEALALAPQPGAATARAYALLGSVRCDTESVSAGIELYERALAEPGAPADLCAEVHQKLAWIRFAAGETASARRHARAALRVAADASIAASAAATAAQIEVARSGRAPERLLNRALALERAARTARPSTWIETAPSMLEGVVLLWAGELERAREPLQRMHALALESDDPWLLPHSLAYLSALESGLGRPERGFELAVRYLELVTEGAPDAHRAAALWPYAVATAWLGRIEETRSAAAEAITIASRTGHRLYQIGGLAALGKLELSLGRAAEAAEALEQARSLAREIGISSLGRFGILPGAVEARLDLGQLERAEVLAAELNAHAGKVARPWAFALAARCAGLIAAAHGDCETMTAAFEEALAHDDRQQRPLERARTQLAYGSALRRASRKRDARVALEAAGEAFAAAGASAWAHRAREELRRIGGRQSPARDELSATEAQIAALVASGRSNAETAAALQLSPRTVEWNLSKIYRKLAVRSRTELAATLRQN
jgi:DNA-binding CsgD family transcriptional regulator